MSRVHQYDDDVDSDLTPLTPISLSQRRKQPPTSLPPPLRADSNDYDYDTSDGHDTPNYHDARHLSRRQQAHLDKLIKILKVVGIHPDVPL